MRRIQVALAVSVAAAAAGCGGMAHLVFLPGDLLESVLDAARAPDHPPLPEAAGPVERALHEAARRRDRPELLIDTRDPGDDPKLRARACDEGDTRVCGDLGGFFVFLVGAPELGLALWERACDAGHSDRCADAADVYARRGLRLSDPDRALALDVRACTPQSMRPHACRRAAQHETLPPAQRFLLLDRGCELADDDACRDVSRFLRNPPLGLKDDDPLVVYYARPARRGVAPTPGGEDRDPVSLSKRDAYAKLLEAPARASRGRSVIWPGHSSGLGY